MDEYRSWNSNTVDLLPEQHRWRARDVTYYRGPWARLKKLIPGFELGPFRVGEDGPENQHLRMVVRRPLNQTENPIPIGTVSPAYSLAPHEEVGELCLRGLAKCGVEQSELRPELGLTQLGEWMNLRFVLPKCFSLIDRSGIETALRLECFNSVDGSSRLIIVFGWIRFICSNGLIIGETMIEIRERHDGSLALDEIPMRIARAFDKARADKEHRQALQEKNVSVRSIEAWVNGELARAWGKKAAARVFNICRTGHDAELIDPFAKGEATEKPTRSTERVPGSPEVASTLFDVMQAMSHVAAKRTDALEQQKMLRSLDGLLANLG